MKTLVSKRFSIDQCRLNFKTLFVFGDNEQRSGMGGQAIIREQENSIGICTKKAPSMDISSFFTDNELEQNKAIIDEDIVRVKEYAEQIGVRDIAFPQMGLGTGLADMPRKCPKTFLYLCHRLLEEFQFNNIEFLKSSI